jgi:two-component system LytT family response regulator
MSNRLRALVVDDEPLVRQGLSAALAGQPVDIVGEARNGLEALESIQELEPDLVFLDVEMPEASGMDVVRALAAEGATLPGIVFVTAFDKYAVQAFEHHAIDYLLKPFDYARVAVAVERAMERAGRPSNDAAQINALIQQLERHATTHSPFFSVKSGNRVVLLKRSEVEWFEAKGNYVRLYSCGTWHVIRETMKDLEAGLDPQHFARVHRSAIVNLERVSEFRPLASGDLVVVMQSGVEIAMSRRYRKSVEARIGRPR